MEKKNQLAKTNGRQVTEVKSGYVSASANMAAVFAEEMDGLTPQFDRIKIPSGGGLAFETPGEDPDSPDMVKEIKAVILYHQPIRAYYKDKYTGGNTPPDCGSMDGHIGIVGETGEVKNCRECPLAKFGSGENGAKACKEKRRLYILREGEALPIILTLSTGSISDYSKYVMRLLSKGKKTNTVVTKFTLRKEQNSGGITFSVAVCSVDRDLTAAELPVIESMSAQVKGLALRIVESDDGE
ncbi:MAG: hypothetical protein FWD58_02090 [Firmicutes bacterium]|nr:hypothetical protein [Bacillota bacterium]